MTTPEGSILEVLDPVAAVAKKSVAPAPRLGDLSGCRIGLYWNRKAGGDVALEEVARLLGGKFQNLEFEKFYYSEPAGKAILDKIAGSGCNAIVGATAD